MTNACRRTLKLCSAVAGFACLVLPAWSQWHPKESEWPTYTADLAGSKYRPLDQIDASNFNKLEIAWRFKTDNLGTRPEYKLEGTPLMVNGVIYATGGTRRAVVALEAKTGELIWMHSVREGVRAAISPRQLSGRGLAFWSDGKGDDRIIYVTTGYRLMELNARNGQPIQSFGKEGTIDLKVGMVTGSGQQIDLEQGEAGLHSAPTVVNDVVIVGSAFKEGMTVPTHNNTKGLVRAFDVKSGKLIWTFHTIPKPGEFGNETWENGSWATNGNTGVWTQITVDPQLGLVYLPVESPTSDFYGGERPGNNLFGESLVAVDLKTGQRKWHYQIVHHPIWDYDLSSAPLLMDIRVDGKTVKAVAVPTKESFLYVFDRATGKPVWPIEERAVPQSDVPGEKSSPTQPFPTRPPPYARAWLKIPDDLIDFTPEMRAEAQERIKHHRVEGMFTPPVVGDPNKFLGGISMGNATGGTNWAGGGFDPETHTVYVQAANAFVSSVSVRKSPEGFSDIRYVAGREDQPFRVMEGPGYGSAADAQQPKRGGGRAAAVEGAAAAGAGRGAAGAAPAGGGGAAAGSLLIQGLPIVKPPYGVLSAIDLDKGDLKWQVPYGETPDNIRLHPALKGKEIPNTGMNGYNGCGVLVTKTLVIIGDTQVTSVTHPRGAMMRAYDKATGKEVGAVWMPAPVSGSPMTYMWQGKQYIVIAVSGGNYSGEYLAFALPDAE